MYYTGRICMIWQHHIDFALLESHWFSRFRVNTQNGRICRSPSVLMRLFNNVGVHFSSLTFSSWKIWISVSLVHNEINFAAKMDINWWKRFDEGGNFDANHIKDLREIYQIEHNVAVAWTSTLKSNCRGILVEGYLDDAWVRNDYPHPQTFNLLCKSISMFVLEVQRKG